jgi:hypothetical protein
MKATEQATLDVALVIFQTLGGVYTVWLVGASYYLQNRNNLADPPIGGYLPAILVGTSAALQLALALTVATITFYTSFGIDVALYVLVLIPAGLEAGFIEIVKHKMDESKATLARILILSTTLTVGYTFVLPNT